MEYSLQSNRLVVLHEDTGRDPWFSAVTALDLAAGGRMLCRLSASVCALHPLQKLVECCEVCGYCPRLPSDSLLDTHHIKCQSVAGDNDTVDGVLKGSVSNLRFCASSDQKLPCAAHGCITAGVNPRAQDEVWNCGVYTAGWRLWQRGGGRMCPQP